MARFLLKGSRMRWLVLSVVIALSLASSGAMADTQTRIIVRNLGTSTTRAQVSLGPTAPCDSSDDRMMFDAVLAAGETRVIPLGSATTACVRNTSTGSTIDWVPSRFVSGGYRCAPGHHGPCWPDASVPLRFDITP